MTLNLHTNHYNHMFSGISIDIKEIEILMRKQLTESMHLPNPGCAAHCQFLQVAESL